MAFWGSANCCALLLCGALPICASTIVDTGVGSNGPAIFASQFEEQGWTQTQTYTGVSIQVALYSWTPGATFTGTAYLTNAIGSGADPSVSDSVTYSGETSNTTPETLTLFSGLTLGPGTYFLTLSSTDSAGIMPGAIWDACASTPCAPVTLAPGVTLLSQEFANGMGGTVENLAAPADSNFAASNEILNLTVTGNSLNRNSVDPSAPEPSSFAATFAVFVAWLAFVPIVRRRRSRR